MRYNALTQRVVLQWQAKHTKRAICDTRSAPGTHSDCGVLGFVGFRGAPEEALKLHAQLMQVAACLPTRYAVPATDRW
eukprot:1019508-Rhodomonas_salina.2